MFYRVVPLSNSFMLASILGGLISIFYIARLDHPSANTWGFTLFLFFTLMFVASLVSMTLAPIEAEFDVKREKNRRLK